MRMHGTVFIRQRKRSRVAMSKLLEKAKAIGANYALIVHGKDRYTRFYKRGSWEVSRNCLLYWNELRQRWDNSSELGFQNIEYGLRMTNRKYDLIDFDNESRKSG